MLPRCIAIREQRAGQVWVHVPHGDPVETWIDLESGGRRHGCASSRTGRPRTISTVGWSGEASFEIPADLPLGYHTLRARSGDIGVGDAADRYSGVARFPGADGRPASLGSGDPALQRALGPVLGCRRPDRPDRPRRVVRGRARRRLRADQPAARGRAGRADGTVALSADESAVRQPALPAAGADSGVRRLHRPAEGPDQRALSAHWIPDRARSIGTTPGRRSARRWS